MITLQETRSVDSMNIPKKRIHFITKRLINVDSVSYIIKKTSQQTHVDALF